LYHYFGKYEQELSLINKTLEIDPQNAQAYFMKGMMYKERGDTAKAFSNMQSAIEKDPDYYNAYIQLGLLAAAKNNPVAEDHYLNAIKINPMSEEAHYHLGMYYQQTGRYDKAVVSYDNILRINPEHFDALFNLGVVHNRFLENPDKGIEYFNRAIIVDPKSPRGYYGRGVCYEKKGEKQKAIADYKMALEKDADFTFAALALEKIERLKD
ncbi:MAG TPA: tetratricopeptide repeat protein, partial [Bacteroidia bacterium]|nr:tetratricopeptide repeat protein [Bacteroidia bacterium]